MEITFVNLSNIISALGNASPPGRRFLRAMAAWQVKEPRDVSRVCGAEYESAINAVTRQRAY